MGSVAAEHRDWQASADPGQASRRFILANPRSFRMGGRNRGQRIEQIANDHQTPLFRVQGPTEIAAVLSQVQPGPSDQLIIVGGDGTLQAAVSELAGPAEQGLAPTLCMLGGGRTNFTARDLGSHARLLCSLEQLLTSPADWQSSERPVLRISGSEHGTLHGFFVAGALVDAVIRDLHAFRLRGGPLRRSNLSTPWRLLQLGVLALIGRQRFALPELSITAEGLGEARGSMRIFLATSLQHDKGLLNPYADRGQGQLRVTAIRAGAQNFWLRLPRLLTGRLDPAHGPEKGFLSGRASGLQVSGLASICLDGQEYPLDPSEALEIDTGPVFRFLHP